jgi:hypothetical protein
MTMTETETKLRDAISQLQLAMHHSDNDDFFRSCINSYISLARSITFVMETESARFPELKKWYKSRTAELKELPVMKFFNDQRVHTIHCGNIKPVMFSSPIYNLKVDGVELSGPGTMITWIFSNATDFIPGSGGNVFNLCEQYLNILKKLVQDWLYEKAMIESRSSL